MALYRLDGLNMRTVYGITVQECNGNLDPLKRKGETAHSWLDEDGEEAFTDADDIKFQARDISLTCIIKADTKTTFLSRLNAFNKAIQASGLHTLYVDTTGVTHSVFCVDPGSFSRLTKWQSGKMAGRMIIKFREPIPARAV